MKVFPNKAPGEAKVLTFAFGGDVAAGATLANPVVDKEVEIGDDPGGAGLTLGAPVVVGTDVLVLASAGLEGVSYVLTAKVDGENGEHHHCSARLVVFRKAA